MGALKLTNMEISMHTEAQEHLRVLAVLPISPPKLSIVAQEKGA